MSYRIPLGAWVAACALAEGIGMTAAASAARASDALVGTPTTPAAVAVVLAFAVAGGLVEGGALGALQSRVLGRWRPAVSRRWWFMSTIVVAGLGWAAASAPAALASPDDGGEPPLGLVIAGALALGAVMGAALGVAQAPALRAAVRHHWRWVGVSAVAWTPTMAIIFVGATLPDASWSIPVTILCGAITGVVAGSVLGLVSGALMPVLDGSRVSSEVVLAILRSPLRGMLGSSILGLRLHGTVTGATVELPVQFTVVGNTLEVVPARPETKRWWRNLRTAAPVEVLRDGSWSAGVGVVETRDGQPVVVITLA